MLGLQRHTGNMVLIADVDDGSVGIALIKTGEHASIIRTLRINIPIENRTPDQSIAAIGASLQENVQKIVADTGTMPMPIAEVYCIVRSPWTQFRTAQTEEVYAEARSVTQGSIDALAKKALQSSTDFDAAHRLETGVVHTYLNGYPTSAPEGKHATRISVMAYESAIDPRVQKMILDALGKVLPGRTISLRSSMSALLGVAGEYLPETHRSVIVDMGSSSTYCAVVLKEAVMRSATVPEGLFTLLGKIASGTLPEETLSQLRMLADDTCSADTCKALKDSLARIEPELAKIFGEVFAGLATSRRLPNILLLSAPREVVQWMSGFFSRIDFAQFTATMQPLVVEPLTPEHFANAVTWEGGKPDTGLGIAAAYVNMLANES